MGCCPYFSIWGQAAVQGWQLRQHHHGLHISRYTCPSSQIGATALCIVVLCHLIASCLCHGIAPLSVNTNQLGQVGTVYAGPFTLTSRSLIWSCLGEHGYQFSETKACLRTQLLQQKHILDSSNSACFVWPGCALGRFMRTIFSLLESILRNRGTLK